MNPQRVAAAAAVLSLCGLLAGVALPVLQAPPPVGRVEITTAPPERELERPVVQTQTTSAVPNADNQPPKPDPQPASRPAEQPPVDDEPDGEDADG